MLALKAAGSSRLPEVFPSAWLATSKLSRACQSELVCTGYEFNASAAIGKLALERHLDGWRTLGNPSSANRARKELGSEAISVDNPPWRMGKARVHRGEHRFDLRFGRRGDLVGVVEVPNLGAGRARNDIAIALLDEGAPSRRCQR